MLPASVEKYLVTSNNSNASPSSETIIAICERLDKLESEFSNESNSNQTTVIDNLANLSQKIEKMTARMTQLAEAIIKIQDYLNNQQKRGQKSYYNNSSFQGHTPRMQPLTEEGTPELRSAALVQEGSESPTEVKHKSQLSLQQELPSSIINLIKAQWLVD